MAHPELNERERRVLEAVIQSYVETAQPAGSHAIARRFGLGVSPATIRNTMSDLEEKGMLFHPHTSAGRVPTDVAYRVYVDSIIQIPAMTKREQTRLTAEIVSGGSAIEGILRRAAQSLGVITQELGIALGPRLDNSVLERVDLVRLSSERILVALTLAGGAVRTIFVEAKGEVADGALAEVTRVLNQRLAGSTMRQIRTTLGERLRDSGPTATAAELLNVFIEEGEQLFDAALQGQDETVLLGHASVLAEQPEFASVNSMRKLVVLTENHHQHRGRAQRPAAGDFHCRDGAISRSRPERRDWCDRPDADAIREGHLAGDPHLQTDNRTTGLASTQWLTFTRRWASRALLPRTR